ncbi:hypothetical protein HerbRD11066_48450 [Herbidospora sp. RD11066]
MFELAVGLEDGVGVDRELRDDLFDGGELIALPEQAEAHGLPDLLNQLKVGRDSRPAVEMELDHLRSSIYLVS